MSKTWTLSLSEPWLKYVKEGQKRYEGRLYRGLPPRFQAGDLIEFYHETDLKQPPVTVKIVAIHRFVSFLESLAKLPVAEILPNVRTAEEGEQIYLKYASAISQEKFGVCQIEITKDL